MLACRVEVWGEAHIGVICIVSCLILHTSPTPLASSRTVLIVLHLIFTPPPAPRLSVCTIERWLFTSLLSKECHT